MVTTAKVNSKTRKYVRNSNHAKNLEVLANSKKGKHMKKQIKSHSVSKGGQNTDLKIHSTNNYEKFSFINENRILDEKHIKELSESIKDKNLLSALPVIINSKYQVLDGQHRFEAAKRVGATVYFVINDNFKPDDIGRINSTTRNWRLDDYLNFYMAKGLKDYNELLKFCEEYNVSTYTAIGLMNGRTTQPNSDLIRHFKEGEFKAKDVKHAIKVIKMLDDFKDYAATFYKSKTFVSAISKIAKVDNYDHDNMLHKLEFLAKKLLKKAVDVKTYMIELGEIYNYKTRKDEKINFERVLEEQNQQLA